ncbi:response regulator transcription factor [Lacticaseibacillus zhaodongensis]|uniref:response regulator transcription factor n=1 Tax=Lacticaseibacillus zhaodongensis TaxID=2668065 RepID=UPI0012D345D1|nr:response regulator transcription factor [Lacticaseibacillus zhaodongensis]
MKKVLVVDDEPSIVTLLKYNLEAEHYQVTTAADGNSAYNEALRHKFDFIILDLMLPGMDGLEVTKRLRRADIATPIIMLTAKDSETDKIVGLELGADDYVTKPFSPREIIARLKAIERRVDDTRYRKAAVVNIGQLHIDTGSHRILMGKERLMLTPKEYELLVYLAEHAGQILSRERLLDRVWGYDYAGQTRMVDVQISHLREKIEKDPKNPDYIQTVRGFGYELEEPTDA